ncbi:MAG: hypothetical protein HQ534_08190 [Armatimonadetes bacterium]|nr:hypothetical protein [Armatimonadota bacterium]
MKIKTITIFTILTIIFLSIQTALSEEIRFRKIDSKIIGLNSERITTLAFDNNNHLWICASNQIIEYDGKKWIEHDEIFDQIDCLKETKIGHCNTISDSSFYPTEIQISKNNHIWVSMQFGLVEYDRKKWKLYSREVDVRNFKIFPDDSNKEVERERVYEQLVCFVIDDNNKVWTIFDDTIYTIIDGKYEKYYSIYNEGTKKGIPHKLRFRCMDVTYKFKHFNDEYLLLGTSWGIIKFNIKSKTLRNLTPPLIEQPFPVYSINTYDNETFWLITEEGIVRMKESRFNNDWTIFTKSDVFSSEENLEFRYFMKIFITPEYEKWLIVKNRTIGELYKYNDDSVELVFSLRNITRDLSRSKINNVVLSNDNKFWLATDYGLFVSY